MKKIIVVLVGLVVLVVAASENDKGNGDTGRRMTLTEAACQLLNDGDEPEFVYAVMKDLAADHPLAYGEDESIAARAAVDRAQSQGCS